ncbi:MAG: DUF411 domain-containing protein [Methylacidiphilales bacterium]|nr:DUF411 domain-containing protein [Candidatus Methylacidiphilales bacterium]NJR16007.1 DUF411 domain-containing protein [Calothrix sp. CSU_2_0]
MAIAIVMLGILASTTPSSLAVATQLTTPTRYLGTQPANVSVYRSPDCSCCGGWIDHLKTQGFLVQDFPTPDIEAVKQKYHVPNDLASCHTAIVSEYVIEGHVPAQDIRRLLQEKSHVSGLSVPQMPVGTPGMEMGNKKDPFKVFSFDSQDSVVVFNDYPLGV